MSFRLVFLGLSLRSAWGNGHATTYRALLRPLAERGHEVTFLERDRPYYRDNRVEVFEDAIEVTFDQRTHLLRFEVIRVVIPGAENIGAEDDATLHFRAESFAPRARIKIEQILRIPSAMAVTHAIETREIR